MELCLKFDHKSVKSEKYQHWFVKEDKTPKLNTRSDKPQNIFKPVHARTDKYSDSPIHFLTWNGKIKGCENVCGQWHGGRDIHLLDVHCASLWGALLCQE